MKATQQTDVEYLKEYIAPQLAELAVLAKRRHLDTLAYLLRMALLETELIGTAISANAANRDASPG